MATGLLILCAGRATRLVEYMMASRKSYTGEIALGVETDTDDAEGTETARHDVPTASISIVRTRSRRRSPASSNRYRPAYSAVKVDGQRAYAVARKGGAPDLGAREVTVFDLALERLSADRLLIQVQCGPGMYVRSLARDIGRALGCGAHLASLRRTASGRFSVEDAVGIEALAAFDGRGRARPRGPPIGRGTGRARRRDPQPRERPPAGARAAGIRPRRLPAALLADAAVRRRRGLSRRGRGGSHRATGIHAAKVLAPAAH